MKGEDEKMTRGEEKYFDSARKIAEESDFSTIHIGCVLVYKNKIIGKGYNSYKTHPEQKKYNKYRHMEADRPINHSLHAEMKALNSVKFTVDKSVNWSHVKLYVYRICRSRRHGIARPCPACMAKIKAKGIKHIYYTTDDGYAHEILD